MKTLERLTLSAQLSALVAEEVEVMSPRPRLHRSGVQESGSSGVLVALCYLDSISELGAGYDLGQVVRNA